VKTDTYGILNTFHGLRFLQGPRSPEKVERDGYGLTEDPAQAWTFPSEAQAANKARVFDLHIGWGEGMSQTFLMEVAP